MSNRVCCVVNCKNTSRKSDYKFYKFPVAEWKINQRNKWIAAVKRKNVDGSPWCPRPYDYICSAHFMGGKKSEEEASPSYVPTIFPSIYRSPQVNELIALNRHKSFMQRRMKKGLSSTVTTSNTDSTAMESFETTSENPPVICLQQKTDQECQIDFYSNSTVSSKTFICNRYVNNEVCDAQTQTCG